VEFGACQDTGPSEQKSLQSVVPPDQYVHSAVSLGYYGVDTLRRSARPRADNAVGNHKSAARLGEAAANHFVLGRSSDIASPGDSIYFLFVALGLDRPGGNVNDDRLEIEAHTVAAGVIVVRVAGDFCAEGAARVRRILAGELAGVPEILILDLTEIARIDAEGIDTLYVVAELTADDDIGLCLVAPAKGAVREGLDAAGSTDIFEIFSSVTEALREVS
jgi:anti-anti-sigma regulatory factor